MGILGLACGLLGPFICGKLGFSWYWCPFIWVIEAEVGCFKCVGVSNGNCAADVGRLDLGWFWKYVDGLVNGGGLNDVDAWAILPDGIVDLGWWLKFDEGLAIGGMPFDTKENMHAIIIILQKNTFEQKHSYALCACCFFWPIMEYWFEVFWQNLIPTLRKKLPSWKGWIVPNVKTTLSLRNKVPPTTKTKP